VRGHGVLAQLADGGDRDLAALAHDLHRGVHDVRGEHARGADGVVSELAPGRLDHEVVGRLRVGERVSGAEHLGHVPLELHRVDDHHVLRARVPRALHGVAAHAARSVDDHGVPGPHAGRVHRRAPAGRHPAADEGPDLERDVVGQRDARPLRDHGVLGERADRAEAAEILVPQVEPERAVEEHPGGRVEALHAHVLVPGGAGPAGPACGDVGTDDPVAHRDPAHGRADRLHDARALVAADDREPHRGVALRDVIVGVAQARGGEAHAHLVRLRLVQL
jgi:hypothetical protein